MFVHVDNRISSGLAILSGVLLFIARPPISASPNPWQSLFQTLYDSGQVVFGALAFIMWFLVKLGGLTIAVGGYLSFKNHLRSGKELIGIGTGVGLADLILVLNAGHFGPLEWIGWISLVLAILAARHIHGPEASYAGEIKRLFAVFRSRLKAEQKKARKRRYGANARKSAGQHDIGSDVKRDG